MKASSLYSLIFCFFSFSQILLALGSDQISAYQQRLGDPDPMVRLSAMKEIGKLSERSPEEVGNDAVPFLTKGLSDPDLKVRYNAVSNIAAISVQTSPKLLPLKPGMIDLRSYAPLKDALEKVLFDPDQETRQNALAAYENLFDFTPELQARLVAQFGAEKRGWNQELIAEALASSQSPSKPTVDFLINLLDDHRYSHRIAITWARIKGFPPPAAAPKLAELLEKTSDSSERQTFASVIGKYGEQARPYLGLIEKLRDKETDATTRSSLEVAAEAIKKE
jgi:HEAT repeat protein